MNHRKFLTKRGWSLEQVLAMTDEEFCWAAATECQIEKATIVQRLTDQRLAELRTEIAELKARRVG